MQVKSASSAPHLGGSSYTWNCTRSLGQISIEAADYYFEQVYAFPEYFHFAEGDWKAPKLAIDTYLGWARGRGLLKGRVKTEVKEEFIGESLVRESTQRKTKKPPTSTSIPKPEKARKLPHHYDFNPSITVNIHQGGHSNGCHQY